MHWLYLVLGAVLFSAVGKIVHRHVLKDEDPISYAFIWSLMTGICYIPLLAIEPLALPSSAEQWAMLLLAASLWFVINIVGFYAFKHTDATLKTPLSASKVLFLFILAVLLLGEAVTPMKLGGTLFICAGIFSLTWKKGILGKLKDYGVKLTLLTALLTAFVAVADKANMASGISPAFYGFMMYTLPSIPLGAIAGTRMRGFSRMWERKSFWVVFAALCYAAMYYLELLAFRLADVSSVYPVSQLSILLAVVLGYLLLGEKAEIRQRLFGALLMIAGAVLVALGA